jgi:hypothetical protein
MNRNHLLITWHLGMGDAIICNGLVRDLAQERDLVVVPAKYHNLESVAYMFRDLPNVAVRPVIDDEEQIFFANSVWKGEILKLGFFAGRNQDFDPNQFDREFYRQAGINFQRRWDAFDVKRDPLLEIGAWPRPYLFVHEDTARGMVIDRTRMPRRSSCCRFEMKSPDKNVTRNIFAWIPALIHAEQIHVINSSFALLVDSLPRIPSQKLFLHRYARGGEFPSFRYPWTILD